MSKITRQPRSSLKAIGSSKPPDLQATTRENLKRAFSRLKAGSIDWGRQIPLGVRFVRVPLLKEKGSDRYTFTALIPAGALSPNAKPTDPNMAKHFYLERSGGLAGSTVYAGPFTSAGGDVGKEPYFSRYLEGQPRVDLGGRGSRVTEKFPSDNEDGGPRYGGGASRVTEKFPSDNEDGGGRVGGGVSRVTEKFPSDNDE